MGSSDSDRLIGISTYLEPTRWGGWDTEAAVLQRSYVDSVVDAGGVPVLLPPLGKGTAAQVARLDGLVLAGGPDIDATRYGQAPHETADQPRTGRDEYEAALLAEALATGVPVLAICRGVQLLNVALGGTLVQHLPTADAHCSGDENRFSHHTVHIRSGTRLSAILGAETSVLCLHHQAVDMLGSGLVITASTSDGVPHAVELPGERFVLGVQWHPEEGTDKRLFTALVEAGRA